MSLKTARITHLSFRSSESPKSPAVANEELAMKYKDSPV